MAWKIDKVRGPWQTEGRSEQRYRRGPQRGERRELMIEIEPRMVVYRPKGTRARFALTHEKIYELACMAHADANRKRKHTIKRGV